jgi:thiol-disulfide isomerase/thioredoxin
MKVRLRAFVLLAALCLFATSAVALAGDDRKTPESQPSIAERFAQIQAEYAAQRDALRQAEEKAASRRERNEIYARMVPDEVAYSRRMVELALLAPADPAARDALLWVINRPGRPDWGAYGDEFARAATLLVRHHGDDTEAVRAGLRLANILTPHRDALLLGFYAAAKGREAKGLARLALAQYLEKKAQGAQWATGAGKAKGRPKIVYQRVDDEGKRVDKVEDMTDEQYAYDLHLQFCDAAAMRVEAERLFEEVIADYGDVPYVTGEGRERVEARLKEPAPTSDGKPFTEGIRRRLERTLARTLGQAAEERLDLMHNLAVGKPAPEIDGVDFAGKPLKLSDYRGKVVVLVFWGTWCGPCMAEVPHERALVERLKDRPFALLGVDCDEDKQTAVKVMEAERITWPNWHDGAPGTGPIASLYHVRRYQTVYVLDARGIIRQKDSRGSRLDAIVDVLLKELEGKDSPQ